MADAHVIEYVLVWKLERLLHCNNWNWRQLSVSHSSVLASPMTFIHVDCGSPYMVSQVEAGLLTLKVLFG